MNKQNKMINDVTIIKVKQSPNLKLLFTGSSMSCSENILMTAAFTKLMYFIATNSKKGNKNFHRSLTCNQILKRNWKLKLALGYIIPYFSITRCFCTILIRLP